MTAKTVAGPLTDASVSTVVIYTNDFGRMRSFYRDALGLQVKVETEQYIELAAADGADIALHAGREARESDARHWFIEFRVPDIEVAIAGLRARGVAVGEVQERWWGKEAGFADPEGNRLELEQPDEEAIRRGGPG